MDAEMRAVLAALKKAEAEQVFTPVLIVAMPVIAKPVIDAPEAVGAACST